jgi:putative tryptophan/tyrosine transport system substrate-binding protein
MAIDIGRRQFISALGGTAVAWPFAAQAQQPDKLPAIGFLGATSASTWSSWVAAFVQRLSELGWIEGRTVRTEYRWGNGRNERFAKFADELVRLNVDVIVTGGAAIPAAKQATSTIPIVFAIASDAIGSGYVKSLARPGGNITGLAELTPDLAGKRLEILRSIVRGLRTLAIMADVVNSGAVLELDDVQLLFAI